MAATFLLLLLTSCGDGNGAVDSTGATTTTAMGDQRETTSTAGTSTAGPGTSGATTTIGGEELPGERLEIFPYEGVTLSVVGVAADDKLNVRSGPGVSFAVVFELEPLAAGVTATGHNRSIEGGGVWGEIRSANRTGWANTSFLLQPGRTDDVTSQVLARASSRPRAETMAQLGRTVARTRASDSPRSRITVVDGPTSGDLSEITVDVIGLGDDSIGGERLKVFAEPASSGAGFSLRRVEGTLLCSRGVTDTGLCV